MKQIPNEMSSAIIISICIATFKREGLLQKLLESLSKQKIPENFILEIIVVDNDNAGSANKVLKKFSNNKKVSFKYFIQPEKNISLTRNKCVENSSGDYLCFIDDDETASENWIFHLYSALIKFNSDGVFGYVEPIFENGISEKFRKREYYFSPVGETGSVAHFFFTTNVMVRGDLVKSEVVPFNPAYGLTGGEDAHLFERLKDKGAKFINCREAITYEIIPINRATSKYLFNRSLRGGQSFARRKLEKNQKLAFKLVLLGKGIIFIIYSSLLYLIGFFSKQKRLSALQNIGASIGKIRSLLGVYKNLY